MGDRTPPVWGTALLLALTAGLLLFRLGDVPLIGPDEPRYARVAVEMTRSGDFVVPRLQGQPWLEKPVLYYWLAGAAYRVFGETEAAARLPSAAAVLLMTALSVLVGTRIYGRLAGLSAGFACGTSLLAFVYGRAAAMDTLLASLVSVGIGLIALHAVAGATRLVLLPAFAAFGLATLAKGPLGLVIPVVVLGGWLMLTRDRVQLTRIVSWPALAAMGLVAAPWYAAILWFQGWNFIDTFILNHNLLRFASTHHSHPGSPLYYVGVLLLGLFPWTALLLPGFGAMRPRKDRGDLFMLLWFLGPFVFFSLAGSKLPGYIIPCLPPLAITIGRGVRALAQGQALPRGLGARGASLFGMLLGGALLAIALQLALASAPMGLQIFPKNVYGTQDVLGALPAAIWAALISFVAAYQLTRKPLAALATLRVGAAGFLLLLALALPPILARFQSGRSLFVPANGQHVLSWGGWRTAWMAGYFYNDGRVHKVEYFWELEQEMRGRKHLVLCGPKECGYLENNPRFVAVRLSEGPKDNALLEVTPVTDRLADGAAGQAPLR
jgi:4-amino-4-deoxy-L-arabinose transferase-like glycosyltransferase